MKQSAHDGGRTDIPGKEMKIKATSRMLRKKAHKYATRHRMAPPQTDKNKPEGRMQISRTVGRGRTNYSMMDDKE